MFKLVILLLVLVEFVKLTHVTYYEILGVTKQTSASDIRRAYKKLAIKFHPDKNSDKENQEKFLKITEAYETLKDPDKRRKYDLYGIYPSYTRKYDYNSQSEYNNLYYNGLYHNDPFVDTLNGGSFVNYLQEGFYFINFYSPFCPPCQNLVDHWKKLAEIYKGIVKIGAVNCKYHNSFCYNSMRIGSYPSLLFYPSGKHGNFIYYRGDRTLEALDNFVMTYLSRHIYIPTLVTLKETNKAMGYVLGANRVEKEVLTRIAYHLKNLVTIAIVEDDKLRDELTSDDYTVVVFKFKDIVKEIKNTEEKDILRGIVEALPDVEQIDPNKLKDIRNRLRNGFETAWVLYFTSSKDEDRLLLHQMKTTFPDMHFGEIDCDKWSQLCLSLQTEETPAWAVLKQGGGYQRASDNANVGAFLREAPAALCLHTLSTSELQRILNGEFGAWVLLVAPHHTSWEDMEDAFTKASLRFIDSDDLHFGIMSCTANTDKYCHLVTTDDPVVLVQNGTKRHIFNGQVNEHQLLEFIDLVRDNNAVALTEDHVLQILDASNREHSWLVAHLPAHCGTRCDELAHQIQLVAKKLRPLDFFRVGIHQCAQAEGFCANVRNPTARLYPFASKHHYTSSLQHLAQAPYILEWVLEIIDDSTEKLNWQKFARNVISEELNPTSDKKPWLIYFHSPRCYRCYEMYADFAITGILLNNAVLVGKVDCLAERNLCQHEQITKYPSIKLYLSRNKRQQFSSVIQITVKEYSELLDDIRPHLRRYDENLLAGFDNLGMGNQGAHIKHDEF